MSEALQQLLAHRKNPSSQRGIYSVCSAHPWVIQAAMQETKASGGPLLIEATSNQVNQFGGYTGKLPAEFRQSILDLARESDFPENQLILGGDHLGPNPWRHLPSSQAMEHAEVMVAAYAAAGFTKLHLDASMACEDDPSLLSESVVAERAARLCLAAEKNSSGETFVYIVGTEVPTPGGATESLSHLQVTTAEAARKTLEVHQDVFRAHGLEDVWPRVVGLVVQPGVEFNHDSVIMYEPEKAVSLTALLEDLDGLVFEAHSTDYQIALAYQDLVRDGFAILKVGPALTFAMREALFALAAIEGELFSHRACSRLPEVLEEAMLRKPEYWKNHYEGSSGEQRILRQFSYSDRIRYYWTDPLVQEAVDKLVANLSAQPLAETLISAYLPSQYQRLRTELATISPQDLILDRIRQALEPYAAACGGCGIG
jgi:D-tagatose-1,6-bisphosphate aldolase subunit GatZ/KbaZ